MSLPQTDYDVEIHSLQRLLRTVLFKILLPKIKMKDGINLKSELLQPKLQKFAFAPSYRIPHVTIPQFSCTITRRPPGNQYHL